MENYNDEEAERMYYESIAQAEREDIDNPDYAALLRMQENAFKEEREIRAKRRERMQRVFQIAIYAPLICTIIGLIILDLKSAAVYAELGISENQIRLITSTSALATTLIWMVRYLQYGTVGFPFTQILSWLQKTRLAQETLNDRLVKAIAEKYDEEKRLNARSIRPPNEPAHATRVLPITAMVEPRERLLKEVNRLGRSNAINLFFGVLSTITGLIILYSTVFGEKKVEATTLEGFLIGYLPRFTLIVFVELFAYFFLGLYKKGLADIKYFQNEITNIESKAIALDAALSSKEKEIIASVVEKISNTERNHVLEKGQTTVELEIAKSEKESLLSFVKVIPAFAKILDKESKVDKPGA